MNRMRFEDFAVGQTFAASITITKTDFDNYISFARTKNVLLENSLAEKEGIKGTMLPGRSIIARRRRNDAPASFFRLRHAALWHGRRPHLEQPQH